MHCAQSSAAQRDAHRERLSNSPLDKRCIAVRAGGQIVCTAQVAVEGDLAGLYDVVTAEAARGQRLCDARLHVAPVVGVAARRARRVPCRSSADNAPALAIYRKLGFATVYTYHYRGPPGRCE